VVEDAKPDGTYVLLLKNSRMKRIRIGKLGVLLFGKGFYAYFGSMFGPGGLKSRIRRRLRKKKALAHRLPTQPHANRSRVCPPRQKP
jgi:Uri superfamily endonuclease